MNKFTTSTAIPTRALKLEALSNISASFVASFKAAMILLGSLVQVKGFGFALVSSRKRWIACLSSWGSGIRRRPQAVSAPDPLHRTDAGGSHDFGSAMTIGHQSTIVAR